MLRKKGRVATDIVEAAYRWAPRDEEWLDSITNAASKLDVGGGVVAHIVDLKGGSRVSALSAYGDCGAETTAIEGLTRSFSPRFARAMHAPTEFAGNAAYRFARIAKALGTTPEAIERAAGHRLPSMWALLGGDPRSRVVSLGLLARGPLDPNTPFPQRRVARTLGLVAAHLGAALRLRSALAPMTAEDPATEAVLSPGGEILHATGAAVGKRRALAAAALRSERARLRRTSDEEALRLWRALAAGRWSIIDIDERDGKRLLLARRNPVGGGRDLSMLDEIERDVVWLVAMGHSLKFIAYELGLSVATVSRRLGVALQSLGVASRRELVRFFSAARALK